MRLTVSRLQVDAFDESIAARRRIVSDVSFSVPAGSGLGITGESGSGKTTLSLALGDLLPAGSRISIERFAMAGGGGMDRAGPQRGLTGLEHFARSRHVFTLFQQPRASLNPFRTVAWQLRRCMRRSGPPLEVGPPRTAEAAMRSALQSVGLEPDVARHYPHELSTGMCQRVFLAMASLLGSSLLIADEPFASVDTQTQQLLVQLVRDWMRERRIILILVSHDLDLIRELTDQAMVMYRGQVAELGPTSEVLSGGTIGHPYTWLLRQLGREPGAHHVLDSARLAAAAACCFASRCAWSDGSICTEEVPLVRGDGAAGGEWSGPPARGIRCVRHPVPMWGVPDHTVDERRVESLPDSTPAILQLNNVSKSFSTGWFRSQVRQVLSGVTFSMQVGERVGIVGASGQGKTTLARIVLGMVAPDAGQVCFAAADRDVQVATLDSRTRAWFRRHVQMVYQDADLILDPGERVGDTLTEAYRVYDAGLSRDAAYELSGRLISELALPDGLLEAYPYRLSGGERKRLALARALAAFGCPFPAKPGDPSRLLILDEPTAGIDCFVQEIVSRFLTWVQHRLHLSYLVISHDAEFVRRFCHRALRLRGGHLSQDRTDGPSNLQ